MLYKIFCETKERVDPIDIHNNQRPPKRMLRGTLDEDAGKTLADEHFMKGRNLVLIDDTKEEEENRKIVERNGTLLMSVKFFSLNSFESIPEISSDTFYTLNDRGHSTGENTGDTSLDSSYECFPSHDLRNTLNRIRKRRVYTKNNQEQSAKERRRDNMQGLERSNSTVF